jgi:hypothetical protein
METSMMVSVLEPCFGRKSDPSTSRFTWPSGICQISGRGVGTTGSGWSRVAKSVGVAEAMGVLEEARVWVGNSVTVGFGVVVAMAGGGALVTTTGCVTVGEGLHATQATNRTTTI